MHVYLKYSVLHERMCVFDVANKHNRSRLVGRYGRSPILVPMPDGPVSTLMWRWIDILGRSEHRFAA